jgi:protein-S-isoprenylcysteine O-methyltransferase Ste14
MKSLELKIPPPLAAVLIGFAMCWTARLLPAVYLTGPWRSMLAGACAVFGLTVALLGVWAFRQARTTINPIHPEEASSVVTGGVFSLTRNPMYVGLTAVLVGLGCLALGAVGSSRSYRARALPHALSDHSRGARTELEIWPELRRLPQARSTLAIGVRN